MKKFAVLLFLILALASCASEPQVVEVVKTVEVRMSPYASSKESFCSVISLVRRWRMRKAEWPSFRWYTFGVMPRSSSAIGPPKPSTISCMSRVSRFAS